MLRFPFFIILFFWISSANAAISYVPARETMSLLTDDSVVLSSGVLRGSVRLEGATGTLYRANAAVSASRWLTVTESAISTGKGNPWLTAALAASYVAYEAYQWYHTEEVNVIKDIGTCYAPVSYGYDKKVTIEECGNDAVTYLKTTQSVWPMSNPDVYVTGYDTADVSDAHIYIHDTWTNVYYGSQGGEYTYRWVKSGTRTDTELQKTPITQDAALLAILANISGSSRDVFGENSQPYPLDGMFDAENLSVDPTYQPRADINSDNLNDWITKYNNGVLQTTDPSASNYVTPAQYEFLKQQAIAQATSDVQSSSSSAISTTNAMTQSQFEASQQKLDTATATAINATDTTSLDNQITESGFDDANNQLTDIANGDIGDLPLLPTPNLPGYSSCQTLDMSWKGHAAVFPSPSQCQKMEEAKRAFGYILYLITFVGLVWEILRRVE